MSMPPHTKDFYQLSFITGFGKSKMDVDQRVTEGVEAVFYCISPQHVYSWKRDPAIRGYIINFSLAGLPLSPGTFMQRFSFCNPDQLHLCSLSAVEAQPLASAFEQVYQEHQQPSPHFSVEIMRHLLLALLYKGQVLFQNQQQRLEQLPRTRQLAFRYQQLVNQHYIEKRTLAEFAALLHISTNHLSDAIREATGQPAARFIMQRLLVEAQNQLVYSEAGIKEIAYSLQFSSPSHFGKFFKKETGMTPLQYRQQQQAVK